MGDLEDLLRLPKYIVTIISKKHIYQIELRNVNNLNMYEYKILKAYNSLTKLKLNFYPIQI